MMREILSRRLHKNVTAALFGKTSVLPGSGASGMTREKSVLYLILFAGAMTGLVFGAAPDLDLDISRIAFYPGTTEANTSSSAALLALLRDIHIKFFAFIVMASAGVLLLRLAYARSWVPIPVRAAWFVLLVFAIGPGLIANAVFKENWSRPRPAHVEEFGGPHSFKAWWDPSGACERNCSFVSGEAAAGFAVLAFAALAPATFRLRAIGLALAYGAFVGGLRIVAGGHFMSDVIFAGILTALTVWVLHGMIYRWPATRVTEEQALARIDAFGRVVGALAIVPIRRAFVGLRVLRANLRTHWTAARSGLARQRTQASRG